MQENKTELAKQQPSELTVPDYIKETLGDEYEESVRENVTDERNAFPVVKVLHGAELFKMPDGTKVDKFEGVIIYKSHTRRFYRNREDSSRRPPDCSSFNGKEGSLPRDNKTGEFGDCKTCVLSQIIRGEDGIVKGAPCNEQVRNLVLVGDTLLPYVLNASTKSLNAIRDYMVILTARRLPFWVVKTEFKLQHASKGQQEWSELVLSNIGYLTKEQIIAVKEVRDKLDERIKAASSQVQVTVEEESTESQPEPVEKPHDDF